MAAVPSIDTEDIHGLVWLDVDQGRVNFFDEAVLMACSTGTYQQLGTLTIPEAEGTQSLIRWGSDGLALRHPGRIVLIRSGLIGN